MSRLLPLTKNPNRNLSSTRKNAIRRNKTSIARHSTNSRGKGWREQRRYKGRQGRCHWRESNCIGRSNGVWLCRKISRFCNIHYLGQHRYSKSHKRSYGKKVLSTKDRNEAMTKMIESFVANEGKSTFQSQQQTGICN